MSDKRGFLHVILHGGQDLLAMDLKLTKKPSSDPYCIVTLGNKSHRTPTVYENLNPVWEDGCNFQIGPILPRTVLQLFGQVEPVTPGSSSGLLPQLNIVIFDEDKITADDPMGHCNLDLAPFLEKPDEWQYEEVKIVPPPGMQAKGKLKLSLCWEPAPLLPIYMIHLLTTVCFSAASALLFIAANCRWQPSALPDGTMKEPGVGASLLLGMVVMLLATMLQFVNSHLKHVSRLDELVAKQNSSRALTEALSVFRTDTSGSATSLGTPVILAEIAPKNLTHYLLNVTLTVNIMEHVQLPLVVLVWLLPLGGFALILIAILLQLPALSFCAGEVCATGALVAVAQGYAVMIIAARQPQAKHIARKEKYEIHKMKSTKDLETESMCSSTTGRERKRDVLWRNMPEGVRRTFSKMEQ